MKTSPQALAARQELLDIQHLLAGAGAPDSPILERVRCLALAGEQLDRFFAVQMGVGRFTPPEAASLRAAAAQLMRAARIGWRTHVRPELSKAGLHVQRYRTLTAQHKKTAQAHFTEVVFPILTPLAMDAGRPFPQISNLSLNLAVFIRRGGEEAAFARVKVPHSLPRLVRVSTDLRAGQTFVWLEDVIAAQIDQLFPGETVLETQAFRVTRSVSGAEQPALANPGQPGRGGVTGEPVRLTVTLTMPDASLRLLTENLGCDWKAVYRVAEPLGLRDLRQLCALDRPDLKAPVPGV